MATRIIWAREGLEELVKALAHEAGEVVTLVRAAVSRSEYAERAGEDFLNSDVQTKAIWELPAKIVIAIKEVIVKEGGGNSEFGDALVYDTNNTAEALALVVRHPGLTSALWNAKDSNWERSEALWAVAKLFRELNDRDPGLTLSQPGILSLSWGTLRLEPSVAARVEVTRCEISKVLDILESAI